nr:hypothetical protein SYMBAF_10095 [Serratia symbiotica]
MYVQDTNNEDRVVEIGRIDSIQEEYYIIFAERMILYPAVPAAVVQQRLFGAVFC